MGSPATSSGIGPVGLDGTADAAFFKVRHCLSRHGGRGKNSRQAAVSYHFEQGAGPCLPTKKSSVAQTLSALFAAAFATRDSWDAFLVGLAASIGAGISMAFSEGLSDDGSLDVLVNSALPLEIVVLVKCAAHWASNTLPLICVSPLFGLMLAMDSRPLALDIS